MISVLVEKETTYSVADYRTTVGFTLLDDAFEYAFSYVNEPALESEAIYGQIFAFHNWLASEEASIVTDCPAYNRQLMVSVRTYVDPAMPEESPEKQLTCKLGTELLQDFISADSMLTVDCV